MNGFRERLYGSYVSTHAGTGDAVAARLLYRRDIRPRLPAPAAGRRVLDLGCGQGALVTLLLQDGYDAWGVDASPEQVAIAEAAGCPRVELGDFHERLTAEPGGWDAVIATDVLEHQDKAEVVSTFDEVYAALRPGGVFIARVPNAASPFSGQVMFGDLTHETWFTARSVTQVAAVTGFAGARCFACPPVVHGVVSAVRALTWMPISGLLKLALAAQTGELTGHLTTSNLTFEAFKRLAPVAGGTTAGRLSLVAAAGAPDQDPVRDA